MSATDSESFKHEIKDDSVVGLTRDLESPQPEPAEKDATAAPPSPRSVHGVKWILVVASIISSILLYATDNTIVANIIPSIIKDLGHADELPWLSVGYMIGGLVSALPSGKLYGLFNAKWLYLICTVFFCVGSALCGAAPNMATMVVGRVIAGIGGNGMYVGVLTLLSVNTTDKERPAYLSLIGMTYGVGSVIGPIIGGAFASSSATWRWGFYLNLVIIAAFVPIYVFYLPAFDPQRGRSMSERFKLYDNVGTVLSIAGLICGTMAINFGGTLYAWKSAQTIVLFIVSGLALIAFALQQCFCWFTSFEGRLLPVQLITMKEPVLLFILMATNNCSSMVSMYYFPLYFQFARGTGSLAAGVQLLPLIIAATVVILIQGALLAKWPYYKPWYVGGAALILASGAVMHTITINDHPWFVFGFEILIGVGIGAFLQAGYAVIQGVLDPSNMAYGVSFMLFAQLLGITLGLSIGGAVFVNTALNNLRPLLPDVPSEQLQAALSGLASTFITDMSASLQTQVLTTIVNAIDTTFIIIIAAGAVALIASVLLSNKPMKTFG